MHGFNSLQHPTYLEQYNLLVDSVRKAIRTRVAHFLDGNLGSFMAICEDRPDMTWRRHVAKVSIEMAKFFLFLMGSLVTLSSIVLSCLFLKRLLFLFASSFWPNSRPPHVHLAPLWFWISFN